MRPYSVRNRFHSGARSPAFRAVPDAEWQDWRWQIRDGSLASPYYSGLAYASEALRLFLERCPESGADSGLFFLSDEEIRVRLLAEEKKSPTVFRANFLPRVPQRVTDGFVQALKPFAQVVIDASFNHPAECTTEAFDACARLADAGFILNNRMILLEGINDNSRIVRELNHRLLMMRVRPYCILSESEKGAGIIEDLRGWTSGLAVPHFICGQEQSPRLPNYLKGMEGNAYTFRNYKNQEYRYDEP